MSRQRKPRRAIAALIIISALLIASIGGLYMFQRSLMYQPDVEPPQSEWEPNTKTVALRTEDGLDLSAWLFEPSQNDERIAVAFFPGNAGNRGSRAGIGQRLADLGYTVLLVDYRGYGGNPGSPTEQGLALDARAAAKWLREAGFPGSRTIYVGESLGTGVAVHLATLDPPAALLLRSPYTSMVDVAQNSFPFVPVGLLLKDRFDTMGDLSKVAAPMTIMYGTGDRLVPPDQSRAVAAAAPSLFREIEVAGAEHNDIYWYGPDLPSEVVDLARASVRG
ncbi:MAG: alpha/beta hydrolase [Scrofimicrobium sp.]